MEFKKEIVRPGVFTYINQSTGLPERLTVTPETVSHYHKSGNDMLAAGLSIPVPLEHDPKAKPMTAAEKAAANLRNLGGETKRFELGKVKDGEVEKEALFAVVDVTDDGIAKKITDKTIKWVSPWINSFVDGAGKAWDNVISHIALTATPRITKQTPFESLGAAMSLVGGLTDKKLDTIAKSGFALHPVGRLVEKSGKLTPACPKAFSVMTGIKLSKDEFEEAVESEDDDDTPEPNSEGNETPSVPDLSGNGVAGDADDIAIHDILSDLLAIKGITLPPGTKKETFIRGLYEALMKAVQELGNKKEEPEDETLGILGKEKQLESKNPVVQESPPMYMSIQEINEKVTDPAQRKIHEALLSLHNENEKNKAARASVEKHILDEANKKRSTMVEQVAKRLPPDRRDRFIKMATAQSAALSLVDGQVVDPMEEMIRLHAELATALTGPTGAVELPHPPDGVTFDAKKFEDIGYLPKR